MKYFSIFAIIWCIFIAGCFSSRKSTTRLEGVRVTYALPYVDWDGSVDSMVQEYEFYSYGNYFLYAGSYTVDSAWNFKLVKRELRPAYFVYHKDSAFGLFYKQPQNATEMHPSRMSLDSGRGWFNVPQTMFDSLVFVQPDSIYYTDNKDLVKLFFRPPTAGFPEKNQVYFYYSKSFENIPDRFSKMDNEKGLKLYKIHAILEGAYYEKYKMAFPRRELRLEMEKIPKINDTIVGYFEKYIGSR